MTRLATVFRPDVKYVFEKNFAHADGFGYLLQWQNKHQSMFKALTSEYLKKTKRTIFL